MYSSSYKCLEKRFKRIGVLKEALSLLEWDRAVLMPPGAVGSRSIQLSEINLIIHELLCDKKTEDLLSAAESDPPENNLHRANLIEMRRAHSHANAVDSELVEAITKASSECEMCWRGAREEKDFSQIIEKFSNLLLLVKEKSQAKSSIFGCSPYESLMDQYEPGLREPATDQLFNELMEFLPNILEKGLERQKGKSPITPEGPFSIEKQKVLAKNIMNSLGFNFKKGRLDTSLHPFCGGVPNDVRLTTRYSEENFIQSFMGVLHETGHALYEANLPDDWQLQPAGFARGMALHESQSLFIEMQVCRSPEFFEFAAPLLRQIFDGSGPAWSAKNLYSLCSTVSPSLIRVDADEVTYPFHIIMRYRLEKALISGELAVVDLPDAWNSEIKRLLDVSPPDDSQGCLQDIHWYSGAFGYFPTYTMGALAAAQISSAIRCAFPDYHDMIKRGNFGDITEWTKHHIHSKASFLDTNEILIQATGQPLETNDFRLHLESRYLH